jgi:hypothetical protein
MLRRIGSLDTKDGDVSLDSAYKTKALNPDVFFANVSGVVSQQMIVKGWNGTLLFSIIVLIWF